MKIEIKKFDNPILRQPTEDVSDFGLDFQKEVDDMIETMRANNGIGLAAPQVGLSKKVFICEFSGDNEANIPAFPLTVICNPSIIKASKEQCRMVEGCLSFPGLEILVKRPKTTVIEGLDRYGKKIKIEAKGLYARVIQHENDHLNATLMIDHLREVNTIFIGTGSLGIPTLRSIAADPQYNVKLVITSKFKATSRSEKRNLVADTAKKFGLTLLETENINDPCILEKIKETKPEIGIMADFGQIIKKEVLDLPKYGIVNIHPSLLPKHRGPSPVQQTILDGDKITGVSLILTSEKMDAGAIISQASVKLSGSETAPILKEFLAKLASNLVLNSLPYYLTGDLLPENQNEEKSTYSKLFRKEDGVVDEKTDPPIVERKIRAFADWPKVFIIINGKRLQLISSHFDPEGKLIIDRVKPEGKREMTYDEYLRGHKAKLTFGQ